MENCLVSVIIPIYRAEKYVERCVDSILCQTYDNIEVILVDDGSPDNCPIICDNYKQIDNRIKVIHQINNGPAVARNNGIKNANGQFIAFVDSDDYVSRDYIKCLVEIAEKYNSEIVSCAYTTNDGELELNSIPFGIKVFSPEDAIKTLMKEKILYTAPWGKIFKKNVLEDIRFPAELMHEDLAVIYRFFDNSNKIVHLSNKMYYYEENPDSITQSCFTNKKLDLFIIMDDVFSFLSIKYPNLLVYAKHRDTRYAISYYKQALSIAPVNNETLQFLRERIKPNIICYMFSGYATRSKIYGILVCFAPRLLAILNL